jgi:hypothetical protein
MATFDFTLDETSIGLALDPADGFLVSLSQTTPSSDRADPEWSASKQMWRTGYFVLKGERDTQAIYSNRSGAWVPQWIGDARILVSNASLDYHGRLVVQCVPRGSTWSLTLSDTPFVRAPAQSGFGVFVDNRKDGSWGGSTTPRP